MARWSLVLLMTVPLLAGCLGGDDDPGTVDTGDASDPGAPVPPSQPGAAPNAPSRQQDPEDGLPTAPSARLRVEDLPLPINVTQAVAVRLPGGGTTLIRVIASTNFRLEDAQLEGDTNSPWWVMMYARNATRPDAETCVDPGNSVRFWSSVLRGPNINWEDIPPGEYLVLVDNPQGTAFRLGFQGANPENSGDNFTTVRWRNHTTEAHTTEVTGGSPDGTSYVGTFSASIPIAQSGFVYTRFSSVATLAAEKGNGSATITAGETPCGFGTDTADGLQGSQTRVTVRPDAYIAGPNTVTWSGDYKALLAQGVLHETNALVITYSDLPVYRPYWMP